MAPDNRLLRRAAELRELDAQVSASSGTPEHAAVAQEYARLHREVTEPYDALVEELRRRDTTRLEEAMVYLELQPQFLGSGYLGARLIRAIAKLDPAVVDVPRLTAVLQRIAAGERGDQQRAAVGLLDRLAKGSPRRARRELKPRD